MRTLVRFALWPVRIALTLLEWSVLFVTHFVGIACYLMAGGCFLIAVAGWLMGLAPIEETIRTLVIGLVFFAVPMVGERFIEVINNVYNLVESQG